MSSYTPDILREALLVYLTDKIQSGEANAGMVKEARELLKDLDMKQMQSASSGPNVQGMELLSGLDSALYN